MIKYLHWLLLILQLLLFNFSVDAIVDNLVKKIVIKKGKESCIFRGASFNISRLPILVDNCNLLSYEKPDSMIWLQFPDGKIRAPNGLCLTTEDHLVQATKCSSNKSNHETWTINSSGVIKNKNNKCLKLSKENNELQAIQCFEDHNIKDLQDAELLVSLEPHDDVTHQLQAVKYAGKKIFMLDSHRFSEIQLQYGKTSSSLTSLFSEVKQVKHMESKIDQKMQEAEIIIQAAKSHQEELATIEHFGSGVLVEVYDNTDTKGLLPSMAFPLDSININPELLKSYGVPTEGPLCIKIKAFISVPRDGYYTFVARDLNSSMFISVDRRQILSQWIRPIMNSVPSLPIYLKKNYPVPILIESSAVLSAPSFKLNWRSANFNEKPIPRSFLFPNVIDEFCPAKTRRLLNCNTTFDIYKEDGTFQVLCPPGCIAESTAFGSADCYSLDSSICFAATHSGFLPERGGVVLISVTRKKKIPFYPSVENFSGINTQLHSEGFGCGKINSYESQFLPSFAVTDVKFVDVTSLLTSSNNPKIFSGYEGIVSNAENVLLTKSGGGGKYITDITLSCGDSPLDPSYYSIGGSILVKKSKSDKDPVVSDAYITVNEVNESLIYPTFYGWTRKTCGNMNLYVKHLLPSAPMDYPSHSLSCEDTFDIPSIKNSPLTSFVVRCPQHCEKKNIPVFGLFLYDHQSSICRASIHAGVISSHGGLVQISKIDGITTRNGKQKVIRNNIIAYLVKSSAPSYYLSPPRGNICSYPNIPGLVHENDLTMVAPVSYLEVSQKLNPAPPAVELSKKEAAMPNQIKHIKNVYDVVKIPQTSSTILPLTSPTMLEYSQFPVDLPNSLQYQVGFSSNVPFIMKQKENENIQPLTSTNKNFTHREKEKEKEKEKLTAKINSNYESRQENNPKQRFQEVLLKQKDKLAVLQHQTIEMENKFDLTNSQISDLHAELAKIRNNQKMRDSKRAEILAALQEISDSFHKRLREKEAEIHELEQVLMNTSPLYSPTFSETFKDLNINKNYVIIDGIESSFGPSNWHFQKILDKDYAIVQNSSISSKSFGTMAIVRDRNLSKGFVFADILIPSMGLSVALIFKYVNNKNFKAFEVSGDGKVYFREMKNGVLSMPLGSVQLKLMSNLLKVGVDFGLKNVRGFIDGKPVTGLQIAQDPNVSTGGSFGMATNGVSGIAVFSKFIAGPLDKENQAGSKAFGTLNPNVKTTKNTEKIKTVNPQEKHESFYIHSVPSSTEISKINCALPFKEELNTPMAENWLIQPNSGWTLGGDEFNKFFVGVNAAYGSSFTANAILLKRSQICVPLKSAKIIVAVRLEPLSRAGIIWRVSSYSSFYAAIFDNETTTSSKISILKVNNRIPYEFSTELMNAAQKEFYKLEVFDDSSKIQILLNGERVLEETLPSNEKEGQIGLIILKGKAYFKDFEINSLERRNIS